MQIKNKIRLLLLTLFFLVGFSSIEPLKSNLKEEQEINTTAISHIIGLTIETRPDSINIEEIKRFNLYGVTRVQLGIQHTNDRILKKINRQSRNNDSKKAIKALVGLGIFSFFILLRINFFI